MATTPRNPWVVLFSTSLAVFAVFLDTTILFVAFPSISADFSSVSPSSLSWVLHAYTIVFAAALIPAGRLADRIALVLSHRKVKPGLTATVAIVIVGALIASAYTVFRQECDDPDTVQAQVQKRPNGDATIHVTEVSRDDAS